MGSEGLCGFVGLKVSQSSKAKRYRTQQPYFGGLYEEDNRSTRFDRRHGRFYVRVDANTAGRGEELDVEDVPFEVLASQRHEGVQKQPLWFHLKRTGSDRQDQALEVPPHHIKTGCDVWISYIHLHAQKAHLAAKTHP